MSHRRSLLVPSPNWGRGCAGGDQLGSAWGGLATGVHTLFCLSRRRSFQLPPHTSVGPSACLQCLGHSGLLSGSIDRVFMLGRRTFGPTVSHTTRQEAPQEGVAALLRFGDGRETLPGRFGAASVGPPPPSNPPGGRRGDGGPTDPEGPWRSVHRTAETCACQQGAPFAPTGTQRVLPSHRGRLVWGVPQKNLCSRTRAPAQRPVGAGHGGGVVFGPSFSFARGRLGILFSLSQQDSDADAAETIAHGEGRPGQCRGVW